MGDDAVEKKTLTLSLLFLGPFNSSTPRSRDTEDKCLVQGHKLLLRFEPRPLDSESKAQINTPHTKFSTGTGENPGKTILPYLRIN